ncbi:complement factor H isoform X2 [Oreochromis niloticus]|uniref:complement factor H isoform X2 n=1 Tax=Oreochromis niloticus TaxID=8128 RepID=UPI000DF1AEF0|nr:complement factor H isoform X2 [Oreochromis niloticus]
MDQTHKDNMHAITKSSILFLCICALTSVTSQEVTCSRPQDRALSSRQSWRWWLNKLGDTVRYTCISGYRSTGGVTQATCTRDGWEPNPLCQEIKCRRQQFRNADIIGNIQAEYRYNDRVQYNCRRGYKGNFTLICREDGWHGSSECTEIKCELTLPPLPGTTYEPAYRNRFSPGEKVTVTCGERYWIVGTRTPSVETTCNEDGEWTVRPVCQEVACSRPHDRLLSYWEVSWRWESKKLGDTVRYTCRSGYKRKDGVTQATCTRDGWEPNPLCQEIKCRRKHFNNADITGKIQAEYRYNDRVQYNCKRGYEGSFTLTCREDGWHGSNECPASTCEAPVIENGFVLGDIKEYNEREIINYECNPQYKRVQELPSRCTKIGDRAEWIPTPECEEIKCELTLTPLPGTTYEPANRNRFSPGETIRVTCEERYWIGATRTLSVETTCKEDGEWTVRPVCQELTCSRPHDRLLSYWEDSWRGESKKLGDTASYTCRSGYKRKDGVTRATCTRDGWEPNPLCQEIKCRRKHFNNADITGKIQAEYRYNDRVQYNCRRGYEGSFTLTCREDGWHGSNECPEEQKCGEAPVIPNGEATLGRTEQQGQSQEMIYITCNEGYSAKIEELTCRDGRWDLNGSLDDICRSNHDNCRPPPKVENAAITTPYQKQYPSGSEVTYQCFDNYITEGKATINCIAGEWKELTIKCLQIPPCGTPPPLEDGDTKTAMKEHYSHNETIEYMCQSYYIMEGEPYKTCLYGEWTGHMRCLRPCIVNEDEMRQHNITLKSSGTKYLVHDEIIEFRCTRGLPMGNVAMRQRCNSGVLVLPTCRE